MDSVDLIKGMNGMAVVGSILGNTKNQISAIPFVLAGDMDEQFYRGFYLMTYGADADYTENDPAVLKLVDSAKQVLRNFVQEIFRKAAYQDELDRRAEIARVQESLKDSNKPHAIGTVAEIATKLGISKSEVRRHKAAGTLDNLLAEAAVK